MSCSAGLNLHLLVVFRSTRINSTVSPPAMTSFRCPTALGRPWWLGRRMWPWSVGVSWPAWVSMSPSWCAPSCCGASTRTWPTVQGTTWRSMEWSSSANTSRWRCDGLGTEQLWEWSVLSMCREGWTPSSVRQIEELEAGAPGRLKVTAKSTESDETIEGEYNTVSTDPSIQNFCFLTCHCAWTYLRFSKANFKKKIRIEPGNNLFLTIFPQVLIAVGRNACTDKIGLDQVGVKVNPK